MIARLSPWLNREESAFPGQDSRDLALTFLTPYASGLSPGIGASWQPRIQSLHRRRTLPPGPLPPPHPAASPRTLSHLKQLEAESIHIIREVAAEFANPVMLYSIGKDSSVMVRLAQKAFHPARLPFPLLHVNTTWKFREMISFRNQFIRENSLNLIEHINQDGVREGINPFDHGSNKYTHIMKTVALRQALTKGGYDAAFGGARRDEEKSRAKERVYSFRDKNHQWDPKNQRPELWNLYNGKVNPGESIRVFPLSNWTELDVWEYIYLENIPIVPLYFAAKRPGRRAAMACWSWWTTIACGLIRVKNPSKNSSASGRWAAIR